MFALAFLAALLIAPLSALADGAADPVAADEYLRGRDLYLSLRLENMPAATDHLQRATEIDPANLRAWFTLADAYRAWALMERPGAEQRWTRAREAEAHLLDLSDAPRRSPGVDMGFLAELSVRLRVRHAIDAGNWTEAEDVLRRAARLDPEAKPEKGLDLSHGTFLLGAGRVGEAIRVLERARAADRHAAVVHSHLSRAYASLADDIRASAVLDEGMNVYSDPEARASQRWHPLLRRSALYAALATRDAARIADAAARIRDGELGADGMDRRLAAQLDDPAALKRALRTLWSDPANRHGYRAESMAIWAAFAGEDDLAVAALQSLPNELAAPALWHPAMAGVRASTAIRALVGRNGLLAYWQASGQWGDFCGPAGEREFQCGSAAVGAGAGAE